MDWRNARVVVKEPDRVRKKCLKMTVIENIDTVEQNNMFSTAPPVDECK